MTINMSLREAIAHFATMREDIREAEEAAIVQGCKIVAKTAKGMIGKPGNPFWPELKPETIARKARGNTPLLETGELRDSIEWSAPHRSGDEVVGYVGSNNEKAVWHELGTSRVPPRSFLGTAAAGKGPEIAAMAGRIIDGAMVQGGPHYRELRLALHLAKEVYRAGKDLADDLTHDDKR